MQLSQSATYALQTLIYLAEVGEGTLVTRKSLAERGRMPERFLLEILHYLVKRGIVRSSRGGGGGYALARCPQDITLLDVIESVDGPLPVGLPEGTGMPEPFRGWLRTQLEQVAASTRSRLADISLQCLAAAGSLRFA